MKLRAGIIPWLLVLLALAARLIPGPRTIDDSYITFRYARNLLTGNGFVYNPGERVQGTTTPLYTLLMAGLGALSGGPQAPFPALALAVNALADAGTVVLLFHLGRKVGHPRAGVAAGFAWAIAPYSVTFAIGGLETSLYVLLLIGCTSAYINRRRGLTVLLGSLALLTRPDALILLGPLALDRLVRWVRSLRTQEPTGQLHWSEFAALTPLVLWLIFASLYFGSPVAHSVQAKLAAYRLEPQAGLVRLIQHFATPFMEQNVVGTIPAMAIGIILYPFLYVVGTRKVYRAAPRLLALILYPWLYFAVFAALNPLIFRWYLTPPLPAYYLILLVGADHLLQSVFAQRANSPMPRWPWRRLGSLALLALLPAMMLAEWRLHPDHGPTRPAPNMAFIKLELLYVQAARQVTPLLENGGTLAAGDVGVLGYYTSARILDTVGLNSPESLKYYPLDPQDYVINYAIAPELIVNEEPDAIVMLEVYGRKGLLKDPRFLEQYRLVQTIPTDMYGSQGLEIYQKVK